MVSLTNMTKKGWGSKDKGVTTITEDLRKQIYALYIAFCFFFLRKRADSTLQIEGEDGACAYLLKLLHVKSNCC